MLQWLPTKIRPEGLNDTHLQTPMGKRDKEKGVKTEKEIKTEMNKDKKQKKTCRNKKREKEKERKK